MRGGARGRLLGARTPVAAPVAAGPFAAHFANTSQQSLKNTTSTDFVMGAFDITVAAWVKLDSVPAGNTFIFDLWNAGVSANRVFGLYIRNVSSTALPTFQVMGATQTVRRASWGSDINDGQWHLVVGWWDDVNGIASIQVDNGTPVAAAAAAITMTAIGPSTVPLRMGANDNNGTAQGWLDGALDDLAFWKSTDGNGGVLSSTLRTELWNAAAGKAYATYSNALKVNLVSAWGLEEATGATRADSAGTTAFVVDPLGGPTRVAGKV